MTILAPYRVHQTTLTSGTGTYSLTAATGNFENFNQRYSTGALVPYCATDNTLSYEIGIGTLTTGSPDTIARTTILLSSNSNNAVNWPGTNAKDIFAFEGASALYSTTFATNKTADAGDWGNLSIHTGSGGNTFTLPLLSSIPSGYTTSVAHTGSSTLATAVSGGDAFLSGYSAPTLSQGQTATFISSSSGWLVLYNAPVTYPLSLANGGTNANLTAINNNLVYSTASALALLATGNNGVLITSAGGVPSISSTLPSAVQGNITSVGTIASGIWNGTTIAVANGGTGQVTLTAHGVLLGEGTSGVNVTTAGTNGQILIGSTGVDPAFQTLGGDVSSVTNAGVVTLGKVNGVSFPASGTSGGIPYYSSTSAISSSAALTANAPVIGGGAGVAPSVGTVSGNTTKFATVAAGSLTSTHLATWDANGNLQDGGAPSSGSLVLISTQTVSGVASVAWTSIGSYDRYLLIGDNISVSTAGSNVIVQFGTGGTPTYVTSGYNDRSIINNAGTITGNNASTSGAIADGSQGVGSNAPQFAFSMLWYNVANTSTQAVNATWQAQGIDNSVHNFSVAGAIGKGSPSAAITAFRVIPSANNISGTFSLYGIVN